MAKTKIPFVDRIDYYRAEYDGSWEIYDRERGILRWFTFVYFEGEKKRVGILGKSTEEMLEKKAKKEKAFQEKMRKASSGLQDPDKAKLKDAMQSWFEKEVLEKRQRKNQKGTTTDRIETTVKQVINTYLGQMTVSKITPEDLEEWLSYMQFRAEVRGGKKGYSPSCVKKQYETLKRFFGYWYGKLKNPDGNPCNYVDAPEKPVTNEFDLYEGDNILSDDEIDRLVQMCETDGKNGRGKKYDWLLPFLIYTCLRSGELRALQWKDIDFEKKTVMIEKTVHENTIVRGEDSTRRRGREITKPKTQRSKRKIPLSEKALYAINKYKASCKYTKPEDFVCSTINGQTWLANNALSQKAKKVYKRMGFTEERVKLLNVHSLRHTGISYSLRHAKDNQDVMAVSAMAGHADVSVTFKIYNHLTGDATKRLVNHLNEYESKKTRSESGSENVPKRKETRREDKTRGYLDNVWNQLQEAKQRGIV